MTNMTVTEQWNSMQQMFLPPAVVVETLRENAVRFWECQDKILDCMQTFADGWFDRRHTGTHAALEAAQRMCKAESPVEVLREYQDWASGVFERVMADGLACQEHCMTMIGTIGLPLTSFPGPSEAAERRHPEPTAPTLSRAA